MLVKYLFIILSFIAAPSFANEIEKIFIAAGLVDVSKIDSTIKVDLVNSDEDKNYFDENFYDGLDKAYLREEVAIKLSKAQKELQKRKPGYSLQILDAARPRSVSRKMFEKMKGSAFEKYVAHPKKGSMHNYGIAVDLTIVGENGKKLDMGFTPFYKSKMAIYWAYAKKKMGFGLSDKQKNNRKLLADVMKKAGFLPLSFEWWHFNGMAKDLARKKYSIIE